MGDFKPASSPSSTDRDAASSTAPTASTTAGRIARSLLYFLVYGIHLVLGFGVPQRLLIMPLVKLLPSRRRAIVGAWFRFQARAVLGLARSLANVRVVVRGAIQPGSCVILMNHQSVLDIPLAYSLVPDPYPMIPYRVRYHRGIPGVSPLVRMSEAPVLAQRQSGATPAEIASLERAADRVASGELSILLFPEGRRSRSGEIVRFMKRGLRIVLSRAKQPVYCIVADGLWRVRTTAEAAMRFADSTIDVTILGPFPPPADPEIDEFITTVRERMIQALAEMRASRSAPPSAAPRPPAATSTDRGAA